MNDAPERTLAVRAAVIVNQRGLHARAASKFVRVAEQFESAITVSKGGTTVSGTSIMGLMMLAAAQGCSIDLSARGSDACAAVNALAELIANRFDED